MQMLPSNTKQIVFKSRQKKTHTSLVIGITYWQPAQTFLLE